jgi:hypothetical protein
VALESAVTTAAGEEGSLRQAFESYQAQERSLEPYGRPIDIPHGEELIRMANDDWADARKSLEDLQLVFLS